VTNKLNFDSIELIETVQGEIQTLKDKEAKRIADEEADKKSKKAAADAKEKAEAEAKKKADEKATLAAQEQERAVKVAVTETKKDIISPEGARAEKRLLSTLPPKKRQQILEPQKIAASSYDVGIEAIEKIIQAIGEMKACSGCFIGMLAKSELKKINALKKQELVKF